MKRSTLYRSWVISVTAALLIFVAWSGNGFAESAGSVQKAQTLFDNLNGVLLSPTDPAIQSMATAIDGGNLLDAASIATGRTGNSTYGKDYFISNTIMPFAAQMTTRAENRSAPLSDFVATWMGYARDDLDLRGIFQNPVVYSFSGIATAPAAGNNTHYQLAATMYANQEGTAKSLAKMLVSGAPTTKVQAVDEAGVLSDARGYHWDFAVNGTSRKLFEESLRQFECVTLQNVGNENLDSSRIRRDVNILSQNFQSKCLHCHAVQDANNAFAHFAYTDNATNVDGTTGQIAYEGSPSTDSGNLQLFGLGGISSLVATKVNRNNTVNPDGYMVVDGSWVNQLGSNNPNAISQLTDSGGNPISLGLSSSSGGPGLASYGALIGNSQGFALCMAERAFSQVCYGKDFSPDQMSAADYKYLQSNVSTIQAAAGYFTQNGYDLTKLFEYTAVQPQCGIGN